MRERRFGRMGWQVGEIGYGMWGMGGWSGSDDEGTLTGTLTLDSKRPGGDWRNTYFAPDNLRASVARAEALQPLMPAGETVAEMALRFILNNPHVSVIIPGRRKISHVETNIATSDRGALDGDLHARLRGHRRVRQPTKRSQ